MYWDEAYKGMPPWDVGHPQPVFEALVKKGEIKPGKVLDIRCGRGENAIMLALNGCEVTGIDLASNAISDAKVKAVERCAIVNFLIGNVLQMDKLFQEGEFDIVIDSGLFHVMSEKELPVFAEQVQRVLKRGGNISCSVFPIRSLRALVPGEF